MQEPGRRPFAGVDLRRPKGCPVVVYSDPYQRCESRNTKFCYYNNYNTSQPRHYCKTCRRYWTKGGSLRNVPVGCGSRKSSSSSLSSPKRAKSSKRRCVTPAAPPEPGTAAADAATTAEAGSTEEDVTTADPAAADGTYHPSEALGLGVADETGGKEPPEPSPFEWPPGCDLGSFWVPGMFPSPP